MVESLIAALEANKLIADDNPNTGRPSSVDDLANPGGLAVAADLGLSETEAQAIAKQLALHVGEPGNLSLAAVRRHPRLGTLAVGMFWGYLARLREEQVVGPEPAIRNQIIGYLKGKASAARDEEANAPTSDARSELNKRATAYELAAEALESED
jgi:hypothetical protein